jgi:hypothetical protein
MAATLLDLDLLDGAALRLTLGMAAAGSPSAGLTVRGARRGSTLHAVCHPHELAALLEALADPLAPGPARARQLVLSDGCQVTIVRRPAWVDIALSQAGEDARSRGWALAELDLVEAAWLRAALQQAIAAAARQTAASDTIGGPRS